MNFLEVSTSFGDESSCDTIHNITLKDQLHLANTPGGTSITQQKTSYDWAYAYAGAQPHGASQIGDRAFSYDLNGNQTGWDNLNNGTKRTIEWDEENRIQSVADNGHTMTYKYDDAGERVIKRGPQGETAYVSQFYTVRNREVGTKHVFAGGTRLVSKMVKLPKDLDLDGIDDPLANDCSEPWGWTNGNGQGLGHANGNGPCANNGNGNGNSGGEGAVYEKDQYFYHPDHLGSSSYVTDVDGEIFQHLEYFPFGETWVEESSNTQRTPYLFTGKELDEETGLYYFGARYYDPRTSVWQSPDPILADYMHGTRGGSGIHTPPSLALYTYVHLNPIGLSDPSGEEPQPLLNSDLRAMVYLKFGMMGAGRQTQLTGEVFEDAVLRSLGSPSNNERFSSSFREELTNGFRRFVVPDSVRITTVSRPKYQIFGLPFLPQIYPGLDFMDAKTTSGSRSLSKSYDSYQLSGFIDAISAGTHPQGQGVLELVTTQETQIGQGLIDYATEKGVAIWHRSATFDPVTGEFDVNSGSVLNPSVLGELQGIPVRESNPVLLFGE